MSANVWLWYEYRVIPKQKQNNLVSGRINCRNAPTRLIIVPMKVVTHHEAKKTERKESRVVPQHLPNLDYLDWCAATCVCKSQFFELKALPSQCIDFSICSVLSSFCGGRRTLSKEAMKPQDFAEAPKAVLGTQIPQNKCKQCSRWLCPEYQICRGRKSRWLKWDNWWQCLCVLSAPSS